MSMRCNRTYEDEKGDETCCLLPDCTKFDANGMNWEWRAPVRCHDLHTMTARKEKKRDLSKIFQQGNVKKTDEFCEYTKYIVSFRLLLS